MTKSLQEYLNTLKTTWNKLRLKVDEIKSAIETETSTSRNLFAINEELNAHLEYLNNTTDKILTETEHLTNYYSSYNRPRQAIHTS